MQITTYTSSVLTYYHTMNYMYVQFLYNFIDLLYMYYCVVLDFFESDDQDSDLPQNALHLEPQQKWEVTSIVHIHVVLCNACLAGHLNVHV